MKTCLVTGGCGFIGRHFTKKMCDLGYNVDVVDNMSSNSALAPENWMPKLKCKFNFYQEDMLAFLNKTNKPYNIIIHAGAIVGGRHTIENDPLSISYNITTDNELFRWIENNPVDNLVYFSSSAVYPLELQTVESHRKLKLSDIDIDNNHICIPDLTYGWSKLTGEFLLRTLHKRCPNLCISVYRPFSGYGEDQHESYPFTSIVKKVLSGQQPVEIWSDAVRDFVYVDDIVEYVLKTCFHNQGIQTLNIGTSIATSMTELANIVSNIAFNRDVDVLVLDNKPKGVYYRVADDSIEYNITPIEVGVKHAIEFNK
jgi:GDP-L-fucose synthase